MGDANDVAKYQLLPPRCNCHNVLLFQMRTPLDRYPHFSSEKCPSFLVLSRTLFSSDFSRPIDPNGRNSPTTSTDGSDSYKLDGKPQDPAHSSLNSQKKMRQRHENPLIVGVATLAISLLFSGTVVERESPCIFTAHQIARSCHSVQHKPANKPWRPEEQRPRYVAS
jgi:hypothetical protein